MRERGSLSSEGKEIRKGFGLDMGKSNEPVVEMYSDKKEVEEEGNLNKEGNTIKELKEWVLQRPEQKDVQEMLDKLIIFNLN